MHQNSYRIMNTLLAPMRALMGDKDLVVVDYGSKEHPAGPGTYRPLIPVPWKYIGVDLEEGANVDHVMVSEYDTGLPGGHADIVISGQCLEHTTNPFRAVAEMARVCTFGGTIILIAPFAWEVHRFPIDCWRFCPDGMVELMQEAGCFPLVADISENDCYAMGVKRVANG